MKLGEKKEERMKGEHEEENEGKKTQGRDLAMGDPRRRPWCNNVKTLEHHANPSRECNR